MSLTTLLKNKFEFMWQKGLQPSEINCMPYWEFEQYITYMNEKNKEENEKNKEQNEQQQQNMPKMPDLSSFKPGKFKLPK